MTSKNDDEIAFPLLSRKNSQGGTSSISSSAAKRVEEYTSSTHLLNKMHAAQESVRRAEARESYARRRAESESAAHRGVTTQPTLDSLEFEFGPSSYNSQP